MQASEIPGALCCYCLYQCCFWDVRHHFVFCGTVPPQELVGYEHFSFQFSREFCSNSKNAVMSVISMGRLEKLCKDPSLWLTLRVLLTQAHPNQSNCQQPG